ncbi:MAG: hypothetical protein HKN94_14785 [Acidimicrobiales bacterium]|nr:hypothetical protein [Acidimicrobiales bacterium]RZV48065.1 MAG: hypothetical protein EX269_03070 [Acidimicrobiales bacterium]
MSHAVAPTELADAAREYATDAYLLYAKDGSARVNHVRIALVDADGTVVCQGFGRGVQAPVGDEATLSILWPAERAEQFSLIADGTGSIDGELLSIRVSNAVLHRPAPDGGPSAC